MAGTIAGGCTAALAGALKDRFGLSVMLQAAAVLLFVAALVLFRLRQTSDGTTTAATA
jgi:ABC-type uncharacterized transport system permease subunit